MSANKTIIADVQSLTADELVEQYRRLADSYRALKRSHEDELQSSYELRRNQQTAAESVAYLTAELESIDSVHREELAKLKEKYVQTLTGLKDSNADLKQTNTGLETKADELQKQIDQLKEKLEELESSGVNGESITGNSTLTSEKEAFLERENEEFRQLVAEQQEKIDTLMLQAVNAESKMENWREKVECLEDNLSSKREELEELRTALDSAQEESMRLSAEIAALQSAPQDANKKGNSLFAEVDDQRQKMIEMLQTQRKRYLEMKKLYGESQFQMRRLKRENQELCDQIRTCSELFSKADSSFHDETSKHISALAKQVEQLRERLASTERELLKKTSDTDWVDPFVSFYRNESSTLKSQLFQSQMEKRLVDEICWEAQRDLAKWRFEALKSRYIIINRESLLEEHQIGFPTFDALEAGIHIDEVMVAKAKPHTNFVNGSVLALDRETKDWDLLAELNIDLNIPLVDNCNKTPSVLLFPPPAPPSVSSKMVENPPPSVKTEVLTPLATPLVTPVHSPKSMKKEPPPSADPKSGSKLPYRDIVFIPKNAPLTDSLKKKQYVDALESSNSKKEENPKSATKQQPSASSTDGGASEEKENIPQPQHKSAQDSQQQQEQQQQQTKSWGWVSEKRLKNNIIVRRFKLPERQAAVSTQRE